MDTPRFNVFNQIHKGLRAFLFDTVMQLQQTDLCDADASGPVIIQLELLLEIFDAHADVEDNSILKDAARFNPDLILSFESEHELDLKLSNELREKIIAYQIAEDKFASGNALYYALNEFVAFNLKHMNKEEQLLNRVLWANFTDQEIIAMENRIQQQISPEKMPVYFKWMIKGINDKEMLNWLNIVKQEAPDFVLAALLGTCEQHLPAPRWKRMEQILIEGIAIAN